LAPGALIEIGHFDLAFTYDLSDSIPQFERLGDLERDTDPALQVVLDDADADQPEIVHRQRESRFRSNPEESASMRDRSSQQLAKLYRLALEMAEANSAANL